MRRILLSALVLGAVTSAALADPRASPDPRRLMLTDPQMDAITAGSAGIGAVAVAVGDRTSVQVRASTNGGEAQVREIALDRSEAIALVGEVFGDDFAEKLLSGDDPFVARAFVVGPDISMPRISIVFSTGVVRQ